MARQRLRPTRRRPFRFLSCIVLLECCCTVVCELQRTSGSTCGNIACPGEVVQYECAVPSTGTGVVWKLPECLDQDIPIIRQGNTANTVNKMCVDGTTVVMAQGNITGSSFVSYLVINITGPLETFTVECTFDDGTNTRSIGTDRLTSTTAPAPVNLRHLSASDSEIVVVWDEDSQLEECSNLWYNFTHSDICGTCIPARDENMITCTNFEMGECNLMIQSLVCGDNVVNESMLIVDTSQPTTSVSDTTTSSSDNSALHPGIVAGITIVSVAIIAAVVVGILLIVIYYCNKRKSQRLNTPVDEKHPLNKTGTSEGLGDISTNNGTDQGDIQLSESTKVGIGASGPSGIQEVGYNDGLDGGTDEQGSATGTTNLVLDDLTDSQQNLPDGQQSPPITSSGHHPLPVTQEGDHVKCQQLPAAVFPDDPPSLPTATPNDQASPPTATPSDQLSSPAATTNDQPSPPAATSSDQLSSPTATPSDQPSPPAATPSDQLSSPAATPNDQQSPPAATPSDQLFSPAATPNDQPSPPAAAPSDQLSSPAIPNDQLSPAIPNDQLSLPTAIPNDQPSSPAGTPKDQLYPPAVAPNDQLSPPAATPNDLLSLCTVIPNDLLSLPAIIPDHQLSPATIPNDDVPFLNDLQSSLGAHSTSTYPSGQLAPPPWQRCDIESLPFGQPFSSISEVPGVPNPLPPGAAQPSHCNEWKSMFKEVVSECISEHMKMYNELLQRFYQKNIELEREKMAKNIIFNKLKEAQSKNADLMKQLKEKDEKIEELQRETSKLRAEMDMVKKHLGIEIEPIIADVKLDKCDAKLKAVVEVSEHQDVKIEHGAYLNDHSDPSRTRVDLINQEKCTQIITDRNNMSVYEADSSNTQN